MSEITTIGLDLAKHVFQVHGTDETLPSAPPSPIMRGLDKLVDWRFAEKTIS